jgi:4-amino-4-deoxy-L-arabinose transferase-like glycosyltransferase
MLRKKRISGYSMPNHSFKFPNLLWFLVIIAIIALYFFGLNFVPLLGPDESRYAQIAREMFERNDWLTPKLGNFNWFEKPVLLYWMQILAYKMFGVSEFSSRFFSAIFGLLTACAVYRLCLRVEKIAQKKGSYAHSFDSFAKFTGISLATSIGMIAFSRGASFDVILTFPIALALVSFFVFEIYAPHSSRDAEFKGYFFSDVGFLSLFYIFIGVALLAKGLVGAVIPFGIVFTYYFFQVRFPPRLFIFSLFWGMPISLGVAAVWYVPMYLEHGYTFVDEFFIQHHFARYTSNVFQHPQPFWFFLLVLPAMTFPWVYWLISSFFNVVKWRRGESQTAVDYLRYFALAWVIFPLIFFSFSGSKLPGYILPALPGAMILIGDRLRRMVSRNAFNEWLVFGLSTATIAACFLILLLGVKGIAERETVKYLMEAADANGYKNSRVLNLHTISHNAEFYANNRLIRNETGKLLRFEGTREIADEIKKDEKPILILVPIEHLNQLTESELLTSKVLSDNKELAIVAATLK